RAQPQPGAGGTAEAKKRERTLMHPQITQIAQIDDKNDPRTYAIIGAAMEVHGHLGCGFLEAVYQEALAEEFGNRGVPYRREVELPVFFKGKKLRTTYRIDFICYDSVAPELKALLHLSPVEEALMRFVLSAIFAKSADRTS
ncbi:MAG: GxxExxY protein, partial [Longimicrobiales bacterium]